MAVDLKEAAKKAGVSEERMAEALKLLQKAEERKAKIARGEIKGDLKWSEMTPEQKEKAKLQSRRYSARIAIIMEKAKAAGITCTEKEIDDRLKAKAVKKA